jgi:hypothetical protein
MDRRAASVGELPIDALDLTSEEVARRMRRARERGQPFYPWEDVSPEAWRSSLRAIQSAVTERLAARSAPSARSGAPVAVRLETPAGSHALGVAAFTSGTGPLLGFWIESGALIADPETTAVLRLHLLHGRLRAERLASALVHVTQCLRAAGAQATVVKGMHTAHELFPDPGARPLSDIDLVIAPGDVPAAEKALGDAGFTPRPVLASPYSCEWVPRGVSALPRSLELTHEGNPWTVDLHASLGRDLGGVRTVSVAGSRDACTREMRLAGADVRVLVQPWLAAYLAAHASQELKNLTLVRLIELVWVMRGHGRTDPVDWPELTKLLDRQRAAAYVYPGVALAERLAPGTVPPDAMSMLERAAPPRVRRVIDRLEPATAQRLETVSVEESFMWAVGPLDHLRRLGRVLWPTWAGSPAGVLRVQATRARQLLARRVSIGPSARPRR